LPRRILSGLAALLTRDHLTLPEAIGLDAVNSGTPYAIRAKPTELA